MKRWHEIVLAACCAVFFAGCISADYTGQCFTPHDGDFPIRFYNAPDDVPPDVYVPVGRLAVEGPGDSTSEVLRETIMDKARACGVDAVVVTKVRREEIAAVYFESRGRRPAGSWGDTGTNSIGAPVYVDSFGNPASMEPVATKRYKIVIDAQFLMDKKRHAAELAAYEKERAARTAARTVKRVENTRVSRDELIESAARRAGENARAAAREQPSTLAPAPK